MGKYFSWEHYAATIFRRYIIVKRNLGIFAASCALTLIFSALAIVIHYLMTTLFMGNQKPVTFNSYINKSNTIYVIPDNTTNWSAEYIDILQEMYVNDTGLEPNIVLFNDREEMNKKIYDDKLKLQGPAFILFGLEFLNNTKELVMVDHYNGTLDDAKNASLVSYFAVQLYETPIYYNEVQMTRMAWKKEYGRENDFSFTENKLMKKSIDLTFGMFCPLLITCGLNSIISTVISQPVTDLTTDLRPYMQSCGLKLLPYWLANYTLDVILWAILASITWGVYVIFDVAAITDNMLVSWYMMVMGGPSFLMCVYCWSFFYANAENASRNTFIFYLIMLIFPITVDLVKKDDLPYWLEWIFTIMPHINTERLLVAIMSNISFLQKDFYHYWKDSHTRIQLSMQIGDVAIYAIILWIIEANRDKINKKKSRKEFTPYKSLFEDLRKEHPMTEETDRMRQEIENNDDYIIKIHNVSRLFFNTAGEAVPAVNGVSLGIKRGSVFGFLGANGAGKTTLIKMVTSLLPISDGTIEINGVNIEDEYNQDRIAICPQFNYHLCMEMTPMEHFHYYTLLYEMPKQESDEKQQRLMEILELWRYKDKPVREMSGGQQRKLAVALAFYGHASIILLDEPTSSLDPYARHTVHELIKAFKNEKTYLLCTHILSEAEQLCDTISIMMKGTVYTVGSPQYLSAKFGTEYKIDVLLKDEPLSGERFSQFIRTAIPEAKLTIERPNARIYSVPAKVGQLAELMEIMEEGYEHDNGISYFTCSSSSLERVFNEILKMSESDTVVKDL